MRRSNKALAATSNSQNDAPQNLGQATHGVRQSLRTDVMPGGSLQSNTFEGSFALLYSRRNTLDRVFAGVDFCDFAIQLTMVGVKQIGHLLNDELLHSAQRHGGIRCNAIDEYLSRIIKLVPFH